MEQEQIKELWEWCGFKIDIDNGEFYYGTRIKWIYPDGEWDDELPPIDLNSLFKWAVPKLKERCLHNYDISFRNWSDFEGKQQGWWCEISVDDKIINDTWDEQKRELVVYEDPAQALFQAIYKVIQKEKEEHNE